MPYATHRTGMCGYQLEGQLFPRVFQHRSIARTGNKTRGDGQTRKEKIYKTGV
jgi:hypothetical protein